MPTRAFAVIAGALLLATAGCGGSSASKSRPVNPDKAEVNPAGDIPDNQAYVPYSPPGGGFSVKVPEGWARTGAGGAVSFTDKLNSVRMESVPAGAPLTVSSARRSQLPKGAGKPSVSTVRRPAGRAIKLAYIARAAADPVTGKVVTDAVERYLFFHRGREVVLTLSGPKGADNVDPWRIVTSSLRFR